MDKSKSLLKVGQTKTTPTTTSTPTTKTNRETKRSQKTALSPTAKPPIKKWVSHRLDPEVSRSIDRASAAPDVQHLAVMPDVHLATDVCIGMVIATQSIVYPAAIGGDIGCGILAIEFDAAGDRFAGQREASELLAGLYRAVPRNRHPVASAPVQLPVELMEWQLSDPRLEKMKLRDARVQLGTLGRGNHFLELQTNESGKLCLMIHSGSRSMGQSITAHHLGSAGTTGQWTGLDSTQAEGERYINDLSWARKYAEHNRLAMLNATLRMLNERWGIDADFESLIHTDHNHVQRETHFGHSWWVHRKGAQRLAEGELGLVPGSMATSSFVVAGRGCQDSLYSCAHGAGRKLSRTEARRKVSTKRLVSQMRHVWFDHRKSGLLRDEAPEAYKDVREVMRSQKELVRIVSERKPILSFKGS